MAYSWGPTDGTGSISRENPSTGTTWFVGLASVTRTGWESTRISTPFTPAPWRSV